MNMRVTGSYPAGLTSPVDKRIGDAFPIIEEVYKHLSQLKYLAENSEKFVGKQIEFRANTALGAIEWRYSDQPKWLVLVSYDELVGVDHSSMEETLNQIIDNGVQTLTDNFIEGMTQYEGNIGAGAEWVPVPSHANDQFDAQAIALTQRTELLKQRADKAVLSYPDYATTSAAAATLPDGQVVEVSQDETRAGARTRYKVQTGALVFVANLDQTKLDLAAATGASLVGYLPAGPGAAATTAQSKMREFVSVQDFAGAADGVVSDQSAFVLARDNGKAYFIPSGNYDLPSAFDSRNTPIISLGASIDKGVPDSTYLRSFLDIGKKAIYRQSIRGTEEYSSAPTTYSYITDLVSLDIRHQNGAGYQQFFNNDSGGRTAVPAIYIDGSHFGYGDVPGVSVHYGISRHPNWASISGNWTGANSIVCFDGDVQALTPNVNVYGAEYHLGDNANDKVAANGLVLDFARNNGNPSVGGAYNTVWTGVRLQTSGTYAADSGLSINGKWNVGIDFSGATLTNRAAIALKTDDRIYFGVPAVAPPLWHANALSNTYMSFGAGSLNFVNAGIASLAVGSTLITSAPAHKFINSVDFASSGYVSSTVGVAGGAALLPATPFTYLKIKIDGAVYKIPVYNN